MRTLACALVLLAVAASPASAGNVERGAKLYAAACVSCHGPNGVGVVSNGEKRGTGGAQALGPPLRGVGALAADFELRTGYMPLRNPFDQPKRRTPLFTDSQIDDLVAYITSLGKGPAIPKPHPERGSVSKGLELFRDDCAGCHQILGEGGVVKGARVPPLGDSTPVQIAEAVRLGPYLMPSFSKRQLSDGELDSIIRYVEYTKRPRDEGGWSIGHLGPVPEGIVTWLMAGLALVAVTMVIGRRVR